MGDTPYIYMFVRRDLSHAQMIIQTAHAVDEMNQRLGASSGATNHMVLLHADDELDLLEKATQLDTQDIAYEMFFDSDLGSHTAIATVPLRGAERQPLTKHRLFR